MGVKIIFASPRRDVAILTLPEQTNERLRAHLAQLGIAATTVHRNLSTAELYEHALRRGEGSSGSDGQFMVETGPHTGRAPKDKFFVKEAGAKAHRLGRREQIRSTRRSSTLCSGASRRYLSEREVYALDAYVGADERYRLPIRVVTELAWHSLFARNLFLTPTTAPADFEPEFTVIDAAHFNADPRA